MDSKQPSREEIGARGISLADLRHQVSDVRGLDDEYRRGYRDGWLALFEAFDAPSSGGRAQLCESAWQHWQGPLADWARDQHNQEPPAMPVAREAATGGLRRRFSVLQRDGFRCQLCGATAADGAKLHIDHKHPRAKGGTDEPGNLWTLCFECNMGKSDTELQP